MHTNGKRYDEKKVYIASDCLIVRSRSVALSRSLSHIRTIEICILYRHCSHSATLHENCVRETKKAPSNLNESNAGEIAIATEQL